MSDAEHHPGAPDVSFDGGDLDCGSGLLLMIRRHIDPLPPGKLLEIRSREPTVESDLPAWCRMTGNELVSIAREGSERRFLVCKGKLAARATSSGAGNVRKPPAWPDGEPAAPPAAAEDSALPAPAPAPSFPRLAVMGIGSWPRPRWMLQAMHDHVAGKLAEDAFQEVADDAVRLCVDAQQKAGVDVLTDGEQRRDSYASFVGGILDGCQLIPITDLLPYVDDPDQFARELESLDVPAGEVRHPAVFGRLARRRPLALHELRFVQSISAQPVKVALPGPYLLTRTMWMECLSDRAYGTREELARDVVRVLREELFALLAAGAALVQFDEPVLTEVVFGAQRGGRSFMCGALSERRPANEELALARDLLQTVLAGAPLDRTALHICRGNWSRNEDLALRGDYRPLTSTLKQIPVGTYFLELCTPRAGELDVLRELPSASRIGVGVVNQKLDQVESVEEILGRARRAIQLFGAERVLLNPDCGFATFADNPLSSMQVASGKLRAIAEAAARLRDG